jgi:hypothetical protein
MSQNPFRIGELLSPDKDPNASTGVHLDYRVADEKGNFINPAFTRSIIGRNIGVGPNNDPLYINDKGEWKVNPAVGAQVTSKYGYRNIGVGSTFHKGQDYSGGKLSQPGTGISWLGGAERAGKIGTGGASLWTTDPNTGKKYQVSFFHVNPTLEGTSTAGAPVKPGSTPQQPGAGTGPLGGMGRQPIEINIDLADLIKKQKEDQEEEEERRYDPVGSLINKLLAQSFQQASNPYA